MQPDPPGDESGRRRLSRGASAEPRDENTNSGISRRRDRRDELSRSDHRVDTSPTYSRPGRRVGDELSGSNPCLRQDPIGSHEPGSYEKRGRKCKSDPLSMSEHTCRSRSSRRTRTCGSRRVNSADNLSGTMRRSGSTDELKSRPPRMKRPAMEKAVGCPEFQVWEV